MKTDPSISMDGILEPLHTPPTIFLTAPTALKYISAARLPYCHIVTCILYFKISEFSCHNWTPIVQGFSLKHSWALAYLHRLFAWSQGCFFRQIFLNNFLRSYIFPLLLMSGTIRDYLPCLNFPGRYETVSRTQLSKEHSGDLTRPVDCD